MESEVDYYQIAQVHLDTAIDLYYNKNYLCALTLAGAAEEVLGKILEYSLGQKSTHKTLIEDFLKDNPLMNEKQISTLLTQPRNMLKHFKPIEGQSLRPVDDCVFYIFNALTNYALLRNALTEKMKIFSDDKNVQEIIKNYFST